MPDPDRDSLRKALNSFDEVSAQRERSRIDDEVIVAAARRDLARLEGEAPKMASLAEIADACEAVGEFRSRQIGQRKLVKEAAAVLREVEKLKRANEITGTPSRERVEEFLRSLP